MSWAVLLVVGLICSALVKAVHQRHHMRALDIGAEVEAAPVFGGR